MFTEALRTLRKSFGVSPNAQRSSTTDTIDNSSSEEQHAHQHTTAATASPQQQSLEDVSFHLQHDQPLDQEIVL